jgi:hypothetical protein
VVLRDKGQGGNNPNNKNLEIHFKASNNEGSTFGNTMNLSNNLGLSILPRIVSSNKTVDIIWQYNSNVRVWSTFFTQSLDNGTTFDSVADILTTFSNAPVESQIRILNDNPSVLLNLLVKQIIKYYS